MLFKVYMIKESIEVDRRNIGNGVFETVVCRCERVDLSEYSETYAVRCKYFGTVTGVEDVVVRASNIRNIFDRCKSEKIFYNSFESIEVCISVHSYGNDLIFVRKVVGFTGNVYGRIFEKSNVFVAEIIVSRKDLEH